MSEFGSAIRVRILLQSAFGFFPQRPQVRKWESRRVVYAFESHRQSRTPIRRRTGGARIWQDSAGLHSVSAHGRCAARSGEPANFTRSARGSARLGSLNLRSGSAPGRLAGIVARLAAHAQGTMSADGHRRTHARHRDKHDEQISLKLTLHFESCFPARDVCFLK